MKRLRLTSATWHHTGIRAPAGLALVILAAVASACSSSGSASSSVAPASPSPVRKADPTLGVRPLTKPEQAACQRLAATTPVTVRCPTRLPQPAAKSPPTPVGAYTFHVCHALGKRPHCPLYNLAVLYGTPTRSSTQDAKNTPARFLHFEMLGGRYIAEAVGLHGLSGTRPLQRLLGTRTIAGHHGHLYFGLPYDQGGGEYGSHYTFIWRQGQWSYAASLHSWTPHTATLKVLANIISHVGVVRP